LAWVFYGLGIAALVSDVSGFPIELRKTLSIAAGATFLAVYLLHLWVFDLDRQGPNMTLKDMLRGSETYVRAMKLAGLAFVLVSVMALVRASLT
jgi:hypothetical protein